jgi:hypothetical protein
MDEKVLEIKEYLGEGYLPLIDFDAWRVAILRWIDETLPEKITYLERHTQTDEVFVLLEGQAALILGGHGPEVSGLQKQVMEVVNYIMSSNMLGTPLYLAVMRRY